MIKTAAAKPFFYRDLAVKKLEDNPSGTVVISGLGSGTPWPFCTIVAVMDLEQPLSPLASLIEQRTTSI